MNKDLVAIFEYLEREKGIKRDIIIAAIEESLRAAARKSIKGLINVTVQINSKTGDIDVIAQKEIVDKVTIPEEEISLEDARDLDPDCRNWPMDRYRSSRHKILAGSPRKQHAKSSRKNCALLNAM